MKKIIEKKLLLLFILIFILGAFFRFFKLGTLLPPYWEEVALGYDAYAISETLKDHHGNYLPVVAFESFGDWKPSLYFYSIVPFIKILGLSVLSVRLPSFFAGLLIMLGVFQLAKEVISKESLKNSPYLPLIALGVTAVSPWGIMFSRGAWEVNLATMLVLWSVICFIKFVKTFKLKINNPLLGRFYLLSSIFLLILSMYTYHSTRLIAPFLGVGLILVWFFEASAKKKLFTRIRNFTLDNINNLLLAGAFTVFLLMPLLQNINSPETSQRFKETSIFSQLSIIEESNAKQAYQPGLVGKVFYHRYLLFGREVLKNYLSHFDLNFLFISGDNNPRHSTQYIGQLYHLEFVFLVLGIYFVFKNLRKTSASDQQSSQRHWLYFLLFWLLIGIFPASITKASPHALRILPTLPVFMLLIAFGINYFVTELRNHIKLPIIKLLPVFIVLSIYLIETTFFWQNYINNYVYDHSHEWQDTYQELVITVNEIRKPNQTTYITRQLGRPAMYYWFFSQTDPNLVQKEEKSANKDQGEFLEFNNIKFVNNLTEAQVSGALIAGSPNQVEELLSNNVYQFILSKQIENQRGEIIWLIGEIE